MTDLPKKGMARSLLGTWARKHRRSATLVRLGTASGWLVTRRSRWSRGWRWLGVGLAAGGLHVDLGVGLSPVGAGARGVLLPVDFPKDLPECIIGQHHEDRSNLKQKFSIK